MNQKLVLGQVMFGWWKRSRRMARRRERQRAIFRYWDGERERGIDPASVWRALVTHPKFNWETHPALIDDQNPAVGREALEITLNAIREVFDVGIWTEDAQGHARGLTEWETINILVEFNQYLDSLKKSTNPTPTSPPPTAPPSSEIVSASMNASSDSGSTSGEPKTAAASV